MPLVRTLTDSSGKITVGVFEEEATSASSKHKFAVEVDRDMVAVGGGAVASVSPGSLLTASFPTTDELTSWTVASTDHIVPDTHRLQGFALGLKIDGLTRVELMTHVQVKRARQGVVSEPKASVGLDSDHRLVSGGFRIVPDDAANLATASYPEVQRTWRATSKDHFVPSPATIETIAIGIRELLPLGRIVVGTSVGESEPSGRPAIDVALNGQFALTGVGAEVRWVHPGCLLWKLAPLLSNPAGGPIQGATAAAKDHHAPSSATIKAWAIGIQLREDPCT